MQLLALGEADFSLDPPFLEVQIKGHQGIAGALDKADQLADLFGVQKQFARADRVGMNVCRSCRQRCDMHAEQEDFAIAYDYVGFLDVCPSSPNCLDFPSFEADPGLESFFDEIVMKSLLVGDDAHLEESKGCRAGMLESRFYRNHEVRLRMAMFEKSVLIGYSAQQMFDMVDKVEEYPAFLPWCSQGQVGLRNDKKTMATIHINYHGVRSHFTTENDKDAPHRMSIHLVDGPFRRLEGCWLFKSLTESACKVEFRLTYDFSSKVFDKMIGPVFHQIANTIVESFIRRAETIYGEPNV